MNEIVISWPALLGGIALCLAGWTLYWVGLHLAGGLAGGALLLAIGWAATVVAEIPSPTALWIQSGAAALGFVLGALLMRNIHKFFFALLGGAMGLALGVAAFAWLEPRTEWVSTNPMVVRIVFGLTGMLLGALALVRASRVVLTLVASVVGAALIVLSIAEPLMLLAAPVIALASFLLQLGLLRATHKRRDEAE